MGEHLSVEAFLGGVLIAAILVGSVVGLVAYSKWGKRSNAIEVQLLAAQANEAAIRIAAEQDQAEYERDLAAARTAAAQDRAQDHADYENGLAATRTAAAQDRAQHERELSTAREDYEKAREDACKAHDAYRASEMRFAVARLVGQLQQFICVLGQDQSSAGTVGVLTTRMLCGFDSARSHVNRYDPGLGSLLTSRRRDLQLVLGYRERGSSACTVDEDRHVASALRSISLQTVAWLERWIEQNQPSARIDESLPSLTRTTARRPISAQPNTRSPWASAFPREEA